MARRKKTKNRNQYPASKTGLRVALTRNRNNFRKEREKNAQLVQGYAELVVSVKATARIAKRVTRT